MGYKITVLHTNDHHGRFWKNADGEGGMAAQKTVVDRIRALGWTCRLPTREALRNSLTSMLRDFEGGRL